MLVVYNSKKKLYFFTVFPNNPLSHYIVLRWKIFSHNTVARKMNNFVAVHVLVQDSFSLAVHTCIYTIIRYIRTVYGTRVLYKPRKYIFFGYCLQESCHLICISIMRYVCIRVLSVHINVFVLGAAKCCVSVGIHAILKSRKQTNETWCASILVKKFHRCDFMVYFY